VKTISRTSTRKIAELSKTLKTCKSYSLDNGFAGVTADPAWAWKQLADGRAKLTDHENGTYTVQVHGNLWYKLSA
jgi:hypothetical protein